MPREGHERGDQLLQQVAKTLTINLCAAKTLIRCTDEAMYSAKAGGRNQV